MAEQDQIGAIRISKYFTDCGILSRRAAEEEIRQGHIRVNGIPAELGQKVFPETDEITWNGKTIERKAVSDHVCLMLYKPRGYVTTVSDEKGRPTVMSLVENVGTRVYPVGRLDMDSEGLLLLTDDGELTNILTHPSHQIPKIYRITVKGPMTEQACRQLGQPIVIDGRRTLPVRVRFLSFDGVHSELELTLTEGRNRQIRRMCEDKGISLTRLKRVAYGKLSLGHLAPGKWRLLNKAEIAYLKGNAPKA